MRIWGQQFESSQILERMSELGPAIDDALGRDDNSVNGVEYLERIRTVLTVVGKRFDAADPELLVAANFPAISGAFGDAITLVRQFVEDGSEDHLKNANGAVDRAIGVVAGLLFPASLEDLAGLRSSLTEYRSAMSHELDLWGEATLRVRDRIDELNKRADGLEHRIAEDYQKVQSDVDAVKAAVDVASKDSSEAFKALADNLRQGADAELEALKQKSQKAQEERASEHNEAMNTRQSEFEADFAKALDRFKSTDATWDQKLSDAHTSHDSELAKLQTAYVDQAAVIIETMQSQLQRVQELVGAIGDHGVTAGFKREADDARNEVTYWQRVTFSSMAFLILVGIVTAFHLSDEQLTWMSLASRLYLSIATGVLAAYSANQAARYQQRERRNRKLELELRALGPFLEPVEKTEREKFRLKIAEVFFGKEERLVEKSGPATPFELSKESFDKLLDVAKSAIERLPGKE